VSIAPPILLHLLDQQVVATAHATQAQYVSVPCLSVYVFAEAKERVRARDRDTEFVCMYVCTCAAPGLVNMRTLDNRNDGMHQVSRDQTEDHAHSASREPTRQMRVELCFRQYCIVCCSVCASECCSVC